MGHLNERFTGIGRPRLPPETLDRIREAENFAIETLQKSIRPYTPANPDFVFQPSEINAGCWKVIDHLAAFAETMFDIQAAEYARVYPELVREGNILVHEIGPEVVRRTKLLWTKWETLVDLALRARWTPEYYRAYLEEGNRPGSEDENLVHHFLARLNEVVVARTEYWPKRLTGQGGPGEPPTAAQSRTSAAGASSEKSTEAENKVAPKPKVLSSSLSRRDVQVHNIIGEPAFRTLTNAEIMKTRTWGRRPRGECHLATDDAAKSCLDRIRKPYGYPLSRHISKKRSEQS